MRAFCPAAHEGRPDKLLKLRAVVFRAWVMSGKERKRRASRPAARLRLSVARLAPGKKRPHAASFD
jgi:hypothetical protein